MKKRTRRFAGGGDDGLEDFENKMLPTARKYARDSEDPEDFEDKAIRRRPKVDVEDFEDKVLPTGGRFAQTDPDIYERAKKAVAQRAAKADVVTSKPKPAPTPAAPVTSVAPVAAPAPAPVASGRAEIPTGGPYRAPASTGEMPGEVERNIRNTLSAMTPGIAGLAGRAAVGLGTPAVKGWQAGRQMAKEVAESTARGKTSRAAIQAKRAAGKKAEAEAMEAAKPILQARPGKAPLKSRTRFDEDMANIEYKKGGKAFAKGGSVSSASSRGDGIAQRGKTRGTMVACGGGYMRGKK